MGVEEGLTGVETGLRVGGVVEEDKELVVQSMGFVFVNIDYLDIPVLSTSTSGCLFVSRPLPLLCTGVGGGVDESGRRDGIQFAVLSKSAGCTVLGCSLYILNSCVCQCCWSYAVICAA